MCVGVSVWLGWGGVRVAGWSLQHGHHSNPATPKHQHTSNQDHTTNVVTQQHSRKFLMMDTLMSEICWAHKKLNKIASDIKLVSYSSTITMMHGTINIRFASRSQSVACNCTAGVLLRLTEQRCSILLLYCQVTVLMLQIAARYMPSTVLLTTQIGRASCRERV